MKKRILFLLLFISVSIFSQSKRDLFVNAMDSFKDQYNSAAYDSIFSSFSTSMQRAVPKEKFLPFIKSVRAKYGNIKKTDFVKYQFGSVTFKTLYDKDSTFIKLSLDTNSKINGLQVIPFPKKKENSDVETSTSNKSLSNLILPFNKTWTVVWGGDTEQQNYHVVDKAQKNAFDLVITDNKGSRYRTDGLSNEDYYAFGESIIAPTDAKVVLVVDGVKDNKPGEMNKMYVPGNTVILKTNANEYLYFAHFKKHSIRVREGDSVIKGQLLGLCGNSGNSSEPHLHFHIQNAEDTNKATGIKAFFENIKVNGESKTQYSPIQGEKISNN